MCLAGFVCHHIQLSTSKQSRNHNWFTFRRAPLTVSFNFQIKCQKMGFMQLNGVHCVHSTIVLFSRLFVGWSILVLGILLFAFCVAVISYTLKCYLRYINFTAFGWSVFNLLIKYAWLEISQNNGGNQQQNNETMISFCMYT